MSDEFALPAPIWDAIIKEVERSGEPFISPEHMLFAAVEASPLSRRGIDAPTLRAAALRVIGPSNIPPSPRLLIGPSSTSAAVLQSVAAIARNKGHAPTMNDLLLALIGQNSDAANEAVVVLFAIGAPIDDIRRELLDEQKQ